MDVFGDKKASCDWDSNRGPSRPWPSRYTNNATPSPRGYGIFVVVVKGPAADATDAPQLIGRPCDEDDFFSFFQVMEHRWNEIDRGKTEVLGEKHVAVPLCPPQIRHGLIQIRTRASAVRGRQVTA
jgi:hypothetical protein